MKILYITTVDCNQDSGVRKKIYGQVKAMVKAGLKVKILSPRNREIAVTDNKRITKLGSYFPLGPLRYFAMVSKLYSCAYEYISKNQFDAIFIRYSISDWYFLEMLKRAKRLGLKVFIEIPSFPYDMEYKNKQWYKRIGLYIDSFFRKKLKKYVDIIFNPSPNQENIFGIETNYFENGIDIENVERRKYQGLEENTLRFIGVANLSPWHGYDRVIKGISDYYKAGGEKNIIFNIVGEGVDLQFLKDLTKDLGITEKIIFHGKKYGVELDTIYDKSDIAVSSVGFFRLNSIQRTSLKTREACLKGIPFISVKGDPIFDNDFKYMYTVDDEDTPIDVESIYNWFVELKQEQYTKEMYDFAVKYLGWDTTFKDVITKIKKEVGNV